MWMVFKYISISCGDSVGMEKALLVEEPNTEGEGECRRRGVSEERREKIKNCFHSKKSTLFYIFHDGSFYS